MTKTRLLMKLPDSDYPSAPHYFYVITEGEVVETGGKVSWIAEVRHGIYPQMTAPKFFKDNKSVFDEEVKAKEQDGYVEVGSYSGFDRNWLINMGLLDPLP